MKYTLDTPAGRVALDIDPLSPASTVILPFSEDTKARALSVCPPWMPAAQSVEPIETTPGETLRDWLADYADTEDGAISPCVILGVRIDATRAYEDLRGLAARWDAIEHPDTYGLARIPTGTTTAALVVIGPTWRYVLAALGTRRAEPRWEDRAATAEVGS